MRRAAEENPLTLEIRPIAEAHFGKFLLIGNFAFEKPFSGPGTHKGVTFAPSGEAEYVKLLWWLSPAVEYYGDMGAVSDLPGVKHQLELNLGVGFGLTDASNATFVKTIVGWTF
jgi:hypothetical protein